MNAEFCHTFVPKSQLGRVDIESIPTGWEGLKNTEFYFFTQK